MSFHIKQTKQLKSRYYNQIIILMMQSKADIKERLTQILLQRQVYDEKFDKLHGLFSNSRSSKKPVHALRQQFQKMIPQLRQIVRTNLGELQEIKTQSKKLQQEGNEMNSTLRNIDSLRQYFQELDQKVKTEQTKGEQKLSERQRWELTHNGQHDGGDEQSSLIMTNANARQTRQMAGEVLASLQSQTSRLEGARQKMGNVLRNINLSSNIVHLIKSRSKEDNRLILMLSLGLVAQIFLCIYVIRPFIRG